MTLPTRSLKPRDPWPCSWCDTELLPPWQDSCELASPRWPGCCPPLQTLWPRHPHGLLQQHKSTATQHQQHPAEPHPHNSHQLGVPKHSWGSFLVHRTLSFAGGSPAVGSWALPCANAIMFTTTPTTRNHRLHQQQRPLQRAPRPVTHPTLPPVGLSSRRFALLRTCLPAKAGEGCCYAII